eukprot:4631248-Prymnesium_polylepis.1
MNCWIKIAHITQRTGGTAFFIVNEKDNTFPGSQQDGEHAAAEEAGCKIEYVRTTPTSSPASGAAKATSKGKLPKLDQVLQHGCHSDYSPD